MEARKLEKEANGASRIQFAYVDEFGNLSDTPPDLSNKKKVKAENIEVSIPKSEKREVTFDPVRQGKVSYFDGSKGYGFIIDSETNEKHFTHVSQIIDSIQENDNVMFELEKGHRGMNAVKVKLL